MLLIKGGKHVVMVEGDGGQRVPHGPFDTIDEACNYLQCLFNMQPFAAERILGYRVVHAQVTGLVALSGMLHPGDMVMSKKQLNKASRFARERRSK